MVNENYCSRKPQLLKKFNKSIARVKYLMISRFGEEQSRVLVEDSRREYEALIPLIPYVGD